MDEGVWMLAVKASRLEAANESGGRPRRSKTSSSTSSSWLPMTHTELPRQQPRRQLTAEQLEQRRARVCT